MTDTKKILMSVAMFVIGIAASEAQSVSDLYDIDVQIRHAREQIDMARKYREKQIKNTLYRNSDYRYVAEHSKEVAALRRQNEQLVARACEIVRRKNLPKVVLVAHSPMVFMLYSSKYPEVSSLRGMYDYNCRQITIYQRRLEKIGGMELQVKNQYDSVMYEQINRYQLMIDSLLNEKIRLVR